MKSEDFKKICSKLCEKIIDLEKTECIICLDKIKVGTILIPCCHYQYCFKCSADIEECSICRNKIEHIVNYGKDEYIKDIPSLVTAMGGL